MGLLHPEPQCCTIYIVYTYKCMYILLRDYMRKHMVYGLFATIFISIIAIKKELLKTQSCDW